MKYIERLKSLFREKPDPLDEMLIEKGIDPDKLMMEIQLRRQEEGDENPINRALERYTIKKERADKIMEQARTGGMGNV